MRILLITQLFDPENAIKGLSFAKSLVSLGHEVEVVTTFPSYPGGKIFTGYKMQWKQVEYIDGVRIVRVASYISHGHTALKRFASYASFSLTALLYSLIGTKRKDIIYSYYPPMVGGIAGVLISKLKRSALIYDVQDLWPEALVAAGISEKSMGFKVIERIMNWIYHRSTAIVVLSNGYKQALIKKGIPADKIHRVYNWCDESRMSVSELGDYSNESNKTSSFDILYAGNMGAAQALHFVIQAAEKLQEMGRQDIRFIFLGNGIELENLKKQVSSLKLTNVIFKGHVAPELVGAELQAADALLVHLASNPVFDITVPSKTQAYLAAGKPILMAVAGESAEIIKLANAGIVALPCNPADIAAGAVSMADASADQLLSFATSARKYYLNNMSQMNGVEQISRIFLQTKS
jgi:colanic acid biosynthesis glycosyl transferase WcaI